MFVLLYYVEFPILGKKRLEGNTFEIQTKQHIYGPIILERELDLLLEKTKKKFLLLRIDKLSRRWKTEKMLYILPQILTEKHVKKFWN